jgi:collagenase-like PrtC family protease
MARGLKVELRFDIELQQGILLVTLRGNVSFDATLQIFKQALDAAHEKGVSKILVNTLAVNGELSTVERYEIATGVVAY